MSGFITWLLTLAVYSYFLLSLHKDQEAIQNALGAFGKKCVKHI